MTGSSNYTTCMFQTMYGLVDDSYLSTSMSLVMSLMVSFCDVFFPRDVLDDVLD